jgi:hypothetical protein
MEGEHGAGAGDATEATEVGGLVLHATAVWRESVSRSAKA